VTSFSTGGDRQSESFQKFSRESHNKIDDDDQSELTESTSERELESKNMNGK